MNNNIKIAVIGSTGKAGKYVVKQLLKQNYTIKVLVRDPRKLELKSDEIEVVKGDATDYEQVCGLLKDCNVVISTLGPSKGEKPINNLASSHIIKAMNSINIKRLIILTGLSLDTPNDKKGFRTKLLTKIMKLSFPKIIADKQQEYLTVSSSNLDWTMVRIPLLEQKDGVGNLRISLSDCLGNKISSTDLAAFLVDQITETTYIGKCPFVSN